MTFEILIPVRNPTDVFQKTVGSLVAQTDRNFSVLISDNSSTSGQEHIERAIASLTGAGITTRRIQPPSELGRVEHWNWLHYQSAATWLKPLFAGDWLEPEYIATVRGVAAAEPRCAYIYCGYQYHSDAQSYTTLPQWGAGRYFMPEEMQDVVLRYGMQFGPPSVAAYKRDAFLRSGGYEPKLPICADSALFCKLAARNGAQGVSKSLAHFLIHAARFSDKLGTKKKETGRETLRYIAELGVTGWHERWRFPKWGYLRLLARETWHRFRT